MSNQYANLTLYVIEGPADMGNWGGYWKPGLLPEGRFAVVHDGEYTNGGHGPISVGGKMFRTREAAEKELRRLKGEEERQ